MLGYEGKRAKGFYENGLFFGKGFEFGLDELKNICFSI